MLEYHDILQKAIAQSSLSLSDISMELEKFDLKTSKSQLSKLQNGKVPPAGEKLNKALSEILNIDPVELRSAAYREKLPEDVLKHLIKDGSQKEVVI